MHRHEQSLHTSAQRRSMTAEKWCSSLRHFLKTVYISGPSASNSPKQLEGRTSKSLLPEGRTGQRIMVSAALQALPTSSNPLTFHSHILHLHNHQVYPLKAGLRLCNFTKQFLLTSGSPRPRWRSSEVFHFYSTSYFCCIIRQIT